MVSYKGLNTDTVPPDFVSPRVCSTKTRIKTYRLSSDSLDIQFSPRVCSTKTRIKTSGYPVLPASPRSPRVCSTKTRIKTASISTTSTNTATPRVCSTKTRIKTPCRVQPSDRVGSLREYVPLKQGLRHSNALNSWISLTSPRVCSTKTRIKTMP